ncbi:alpha/beta fold hydrolase [Natrarchaeobius sp. A-rgal3]|uniref:alpha/beta fold hydrolase n=1 Tax=Natrarchaeobius versutus TaxID=1679078 RepID=UPI00350FFF4B
MSRSEPTADWGDPHVLERSGSRVHYWIVGPTDGPVVAFTHGASVDHRMFESQLSALVSAGYRMLAWDVRGHGRSKPIGDEFTIPAVTSDLLAILERLEVDEVTLVGHSFGGYVSQEIARRRPDRTNALVVVGATDGSHPPSTLEHATLRLSPYLFRIWPDGHLRRVIAENTAETDATREYAATRQLSKAEFLTVWKAVATYFQSASDAPLRVPLLVVHGAEDSTGTVARDAAAWGEREPDCWYEAIPDAGHNANQDDPERFNAVLLEFLREHVTP